MKIKRSLALMFASAVLALQLCPGVLEAASLASEVPPPPEDEPNYTVQTFIITAYYSPLPGQDHYVTGSYEGDIRLNGNGTNGADGTPVFPGMIAAPKTYPFGMKLYIPGVGLTSVHDRGGAIVTAGNRGYSYDRLDIWMGKGDEGLRNALGWGKRTVEAYVYGMNPDLQELVYFDAYSTVENLATQILLPSMEFPNDLYFGNNSDKIKEMQTYLKDWGYLNIEPDGFYGDSTAEAVYEFQLDFGIVTGPDELGAGHFGVNTRRTFDSLIKHPDTLASTLEEKKGENLLMKYQDLYEERITFSKALGLGDRGEEVTKLQEELSRLGYLRIPATGYFGDTTEHALFKFQQSQGLITDASDAGAGYMGPQTRDLFNSIFASRYEEKTQLAFQREEISSGRKVIPLPSVMVASLKEED